MDARHLRLQRVDAGRQQALEPEGAAFLRREAGPLVAPRVVQDRVAFRLVGHPRHSVATWGEIIFDGSTIVSNSSALT